MELTGEKKEADHKVSLNMHDITVDVNVNTAEGLLNKNNTSEIKVYDKNNILENKHDISDLPKPRYNIIPYIYICIIRS